MEYDNLLCVDEYDCNKDWVRLILLKLYNTN